MLSNNSERHIKNYSKQRFEFVAFMLALASLIIVFPISMHTLGLAVDFSYVSLDLTQEQIDFVIQTAKNNGLYLPYEKTENWHFEHEACSK